MYSGPCVYLLLSQVRHPNCYGIDLPRQSELLAHGLGEDEIAEAIGADGVVFQVRFVLSPCVRSA